MGLQGAAGPTGPAGPAGKDATGYRPSEFAFCERLLDLVAGGALGTDGVTETHLVYSFTRFSNGDLDVDCVGELGSAASSPGGNFFPAPVPGAMSGACSASVDYPPFPTGAAQPGYVGDWVFEIIGAGVRATYRDNDAGHPLNGRSWDFGENDCHCFTMNAQGKWLDASLADVI